MAARTPGLQARSVFHAYWGQFAFDATGALNVFSGRTADVGANELPNAANNPLLPQELSKLEAGDTASTLSVTGSEIGLWTCIDPGTAGNAVWIRLDNQSSTLVQTIRDAHRIVVGIEGASSGPQPNATDTLLNLDPYTAGVSADFIDAGDGDQFALAIAAAAAIGNVDIRVVSGTINFNLGAVLGPLTVPTQCRLIGAGRDLTFFVGHNTGTLTQRVFILASDATIEDLTVLSAAPVGAPVSAPGGVILANGNFTAKNVYISIKDNVNRSTSFGIEGNSISGLSIAHIDNVYVIFTDNAQPISVGVYLYGYTASTITNTEVVGAEIGVAIVAGIGFSTSMANSITNFKGTLIRRAAFGISAEYDSSTGHISISDSSVRFNPTVATAQFMFEIGVGNSNLLSGMSANGCHAAWPPSASATTRSFAKVSVIDNSRAFGLSFSGCSISHDRVGSTFSSPTQGIILENSSSVPNALRGGDLLCDIAGELAGGLPLPSSDIIHYLGAGSTIWEHAHFTGLA